MSPASRSTLAPASVPHGSSGAVAATKRPAPRASSHRGAGRGQRDLQKGQQTKAAILDAALSQATQVGLEGLSIGTLAEAMGMSKSGVFAHFGSREELQISVIREYHNRFERDVFTPALQAPRGLARLQALFDLWMQHTTLELDSGCLYISGAVEFDDRPGPVRDALVLSVNTWQTALHRAIVQCQESGALDPGVEAEQLLFEIHGLILALHYEARLLHKTQSSAHARAGFATLLQRYGPKG